MVDIGLVIGGARAAISIGQFLEFTSGEISELKSNEFESAMRMLEDARHSKSEQKQLLRSARDHFTRAVGFESHLRLAEVYLGLAMCHHHLGDPENARRALEEILAVRGPSLTKQTKALGRDYLGLYWRVIPRFASGCWRAIKELSRAAGPPEVATFSGIAEVDRIAIETLLGVEAGKLYLSGLKLKSLQKSAKEALDASASGPKGL